MISYLIREGYSDREKAVITGEANKIVRELNAVLIKKDEEKAEMKDPNLTDRNDKNDSTRR